jgi:glycosyltransferase involved in cell wall biosynthesis
MQRKICYVTEVDLDEIGGAITNDMKMIHCIRKLGSVDVIYLQRRKYRSTVAALFLYAFQILRSISKAYTTYFCRGIVTSFIVMSFKPFFKARVIHQALSVPLASKEVAHLVRNRPARFIRYYIFSFLERLVLPHVDIVTVADDNYVDELVEIGVEKDKIKTVPFYVENRFFNQPMKRGGKVFNVCYVGRFHVYHDLSILIEAFELASRAVRDIKLILVGDGPLRPKVEREIRQRSLVGKIGFLGMIPHAWVPSVLSQMDLFVYLIRKSGLSTSLLEAAAAGKAIVTLRRKEDMTLGNYFKHGRDIYMVNTSSASEIAKALKLLYKDPQLRDTLSRGARKVAQRHFSEDITLNRLQRLMNFF